MRIDLEQFLALTMALGTAGAIGAAVYTSRAPTEAQQSDVVEGAQEREPFPEAEDDPDPVPAPTPATVPAAVPSPPVAPMPALDADPDELDAAPGPQVESMSW